MAHKTRIGKIVEHEGAICVKVGVSSFLPLEGNSAIASEFRGAFNSPQISDVGRTLYRVDGILYLD